MKNQEKEIRNNVFEFLWREHFLTYSPLDKMPREEAENFKEYTRKIYLLGREDENNFY
ncbi:MAG TPA: hypothetical protein PLC59_02110 [Bacteroidales bacterium]|jgi:hypothetical protein|nr:hypothetical protein [bacterium]HQI44857.1 hypothetical protein [Bacteroidales bacterium]